MLAQVSPREPQQQAVKATEDQEAETMKPGAMATLA
jgi:hypothetical protein